MKEDKVSIVIPIYNREKFLNKCINSVISQTYKNIELILVNDGSTDGSLNICKEYKKQDSRIIIIDSANGGVSAARNKGISVATGKYLMFVDSDDYIEMNMVDAMVKKQKETEAELVICDLYFENINKYVSKKNKSYEEDMIGRDIAMISILSIKKNFYGFLWNKLFLTNLVKENNLKLENKIHFREDLLFCTSYVLYINSVAYIKEKYYHYVIHENAATTNLNEDEKNKLKNKLNSVEANYKIYLETQKYENIRLSKLARNLFYVNFGELLSMNNINSELIESLKKEYNFDYLNFLRIIFEKEIPLYLKFIALKGGMKLICKKKY